MKRAAVIVAALAFGGSAGAHISLEKGGTHVSRDGDAYLKDTPCGKAGSTRGTHVYEYAPGATIQVSIVETISHPGYFRVAFDTDGNDGFKEPASIDPVDPNRACPDGPGDHCGSSDFYNSPEVLPGMDNLNPHLAGAGTPTYTWAVTFPKVECSNCTLQIIQVMEDDQFHGPYDPTPGVGIEDIYHTCIDITLKAGAPMSNLDGGVPAGADMAMGAGGNPAGGKSGGCALAGAGAGAGTGPLACVLLSLVALALRRGARRAR